MSVFLMILTAVSWLIFFNVRANETRLIINLHYRGYRILYYFFLIYSIAMLVVFVLSLFIKKKDKKKVVDTKVKAVEKYDTPDSIIRYLGQMKMPNVNQLILQIQRCDDLRERTDKLIEMNDLSTFNNVKTLLEGVKNYVCKNSRKVINNDIAGLDTHEELERDINALVEDNASKIKATEDFLDQLRDYANSQENSDEAIETLKVYSDTIRSSIDV